MRCYYSDHSKIAVFYENLYVNTFFVVAMKYVCLFILKANLFFLENWRNTGISSLFESKNTIILFMQIGRILAIKKFYVIFIGQHTSFSI